jgi:dihydrofolate reductase
VRRIIYAYNISLDGYVEEADGSFDWTEPDEEIHRYFNDLTASIGTEINGRRMWEIMSPFWPTADQDMSLPQHIRDYSASWKQSEKIVVSTTLDHVEGARLIKDNVVEEVRKLKEGNGRPIGVGGATLAQTLLEAGLIDEFICMVHPVVVGSGKPMFMGIGARLNLELVETRVFQAGTVLLHYRKVD